MRGEPRSTNIFIDRFSCFGCRSGCFLQRDEGEDISFALSCFEFAGVGASSGVGPPLPISNRAVKHSSADGTSPESKEYIRGFGRGRVGRCRLQRV